MGPEEAAKFGIVNDGAIDVPQAVQFTGLGRSTLYCLMDRGDLKFIKLGRRRLIPRAELRRLLASGLVNCELDRA